MKKILFVILAAAFLLRVVGINYGLPMFFVGDEVSLTGAALKMLELRTFIPALQPNEFRLLYYPPVISYIYLVFILPVLAVKFLMLHGSLQALRETVAFDPTPIWLTSRLATALMGTTLVFLTYMLGKKLLGQLGGLFAASFVATSFLAVQLSHFARHWMPATFFTYLVIAFGILIYLQAGRSAYLWAGYAAGIAFGASFISAIGLVVPAVAHLLAYGKGAFTGERLKNITLAGLIFILIGGVMAALNYPEFQRIVFGEDSTVQAAKSLSGLLVAVWDSAVAFFRYEPVLVIFGLLGLGVLAMTSKKLLVLFVSFPLAYWLVLYLFFHFEPRYNMLLVPWFAVLAASALVQFWTLPLYQTALRLGVIVVLLLPAGVSAYYDYLLLRPDTRVAARAWIEQNIPSGAAVALYAATLDLTPDVRAVRERVERYPYTIRTRDRLLQGLDQSHYPSPAYLALNIRELQLADQAALGQQLAGKFGYVVVERFAGEARPVLMSQLLASGRVIASFSADSQHADVNGNFQELVFHIFNYKNLGPDVVVVKL